MNAETKVWAVETTWAEGCWKCSDTLVIDRPDWFQVTTPSMPSVMYNGVYRSLIADPNPESTIDAVFSTYQSRGLPFRWTTGPSARPNDLADRLQRRGMHLFARTVGMVVPTNHPTPPTRPDITVERVTNETLAEWIQASTGGWNIPTDMVEGYTQGMRDQFDRQDDNVCFVLARYEGQPAGSAIAQVVRGVGLLKATAVPPAFRGLGVYKALVGWRLARMRERGISWAAIQATVGTSEPICRRMGFEEVCRLDIWWHPLPEGA